MPASNASPVLAVAPLAPVPSSSASSSSGSSPPVDDPVSAHVHAVIDLFADQLAKVAFPEIDAASLRKQAEELRGEARTVARVREQLELACASLAARQTALHETAARAVAYARIYSEAHPDRTALAHALAALATPTAAPVAPAPGLTANGKRRGRPPKRSAELFDEAAKASEDDADTDADHVANSGAENDKASAPDTAGRAGLA